jgi:hypothetical protein
MKNICEGRAKKEHSGVKDFLKEIGIKLLRSLLELNNKDIMTSKNTCSVVEDITINMLRITRAKMMKRENKIRQNNLRSGLDKISSLIR